MVGDVCKDACAFLISHFLTRLDTKEKHLPEFINWTSNVSVRKILVMLPKFKTFGISTFDTNLQIYISFN